LPATTAVDERVGKPEEWLLPGTAGSALEFVLAEHRRSDQTLLARMAETRGGPWRALHRALLAAPGAQDDLVGCAGVHFAARSEGQRLAALEREITGNVAEVCARAGVSATWSLDVRDASVLSFPVSGLRLLIDRGGQVTVRVTAEGAVSLTAPGVEVLLAGKPLRVQEITGRGLHSQDLPTLPSPGVRLVLDGLPALLSPPPGFRYTKAAAGTDDLAVLTRALAITAHQRPQLFDEMQKLGVWIVLLQQTGQRLSFTADGLPGVLYLNLVDPLETLDLIVHEFHHAKLDLLESQVTLLDRPLVPVAAPWRPDIRTARGVLHGAYVFLNVADAFEPIFAEGTPSAQGRRRRVVWRTAAQQACADLLASDCGLTAFGHGLVREMFDRSNDWLAEAALDHPVEVRWAREQVDRHLEAVRAGEMPEPDYITGADAAAAPQPRRT
jgi:HEXXH motif-containing protein